MAAPTEVWKSNIAVMLKIQRELPDRLYRNLKGVCGQEYDVMRAATFIRLRFQSGASVRTKADRIGDKEFHTFCAMVYDLPTERTYEYA